MGLDMYLIPQFKEDSLEEAYEKFDVDVYWRKAYEIDSWFREHGIPYQTPEEIKNGYEVSKWIISKKTLKDFLNFCVDTMFDPEEEIDGVPSDLAYECRIALTEIISNYRPSTSKWIYHASR